MVRSNLLWDGATQLLLRKPWHLVGVVRALLAGRAALKAYIAERAQLDLETVPLEPSVVHLIQEAIAAGRPVVLASGAHESQVARIGARVGIDETHGSNGHINVVGRSKLGIVLKRCQRFDYVGNAAADLPLWKQAEATFGVNVDRFTLWRARRCRPDLVVLGASRAPIKTWARALRLHQWAKNVLLALPAVAAHLPWNLPLLPYVGGRTAGFFVCASGVYLANDLYDLPDDRLHPHKRHRPLAAGR